MENRAGYFKSNLSGEMSYQSFVPSSLPPEPPIALGNEGLNLLIQANRQLSLLDGLANRVANMDLFVAMYVRNEALLSSQIEGTQATLDDVLDPLIDENTNQDVAEVINYIRACEYAIKRLKELPLCNRLIKETYAVLMEGVRGQEKSPGDFRSSQNWIGGQGSTLKNARYIPPNPEDMNKAISNLEKYINTDDSLDHLVRAALIHYQFETIHPFLDGNGRLGRLLITLYLMEKKVLTTPALYISYFLKQNRIEYYDRMTEVRRTGNYEQWINFFLLGIVESAEDAIGTIDKLTALHDKNMELLLDGVARQQADTLIRLFTYLETSPIIDIKKTAQALGVAYNTVARAVSVLETKGILKQSGRHGKTRIFAYGEYLDILRKET